MIILKIPKNIDGRDLTNFISIQVKKFRKNAKHRYIRLKGEVAYSRDYVYFVFPDYALELAFALSIYFKCQKQGIPCSLEAAKPLDIERIPGEIVEVARIWSERKLPRKFYNLRNTQIF
ncbi:hypothetical protein Igag_1961 [Ignisphaera aggregans DSM 17230]|uniref:Uncharacterized protein n=1 Tax=Ignisphaera aggregans (strain DSM 17230 / JCM 13409 / AQ1.S1) TaxID=583356 RepID=E0STG7_IGNAA|nr:hypothetical protein Igag_1961 [Ignisphaera aggregans DSM 17230]